MSPFEYFSLKLKVLQIKKMSGNWSLEDEDEFQRVIHSIESWSR